MNHTPELLFVLASVLVATKQQSSLTSLEGNSNPVGALDLRSYPCPHQICDCFPRYNPKRMDVVCALDILRQEKAEQLAPFNNTNIPSRLLLLCDKFDVRSSRLSDGIFESLHSFYNIKIKDCHITNVSREAFRGLKSLNTLVIEGGQNTQLDRNCLKLPELSNLEVVSITSTGMSSAPSLCNLNKLWYVNLTRNNIESFEDTGMTCNASMNIEAIIISQNFIKFLPKRFANVTTKLGRLSVDKNSIYSLEPTIFEGLNSMVIANFNDNKMISLPSGLFGNNTKMHTLELANNKLGTVPDGVFSNLQDLTLLRLDGMALYDDIWIKFENLIKLQVLYLNNNNIGSFNISIMHKLRTLGILEISGNRLKTIPNDTFVSQRHMISLILSQNSIVSIEKYSFKGLQSLKVLDLKQNDIKVIQYDALSNLTSMQVLNVSSNYLKILPKFTPSLQVLDLRNNYITEINNNSFTNLLGLMGLNMMFNYIRHLPSQTFRANNNLKLLHLAFNNISDIDYDTFGSISMIETLILHHNRISSLSFLRYTEFRFLKTIDLSHNKLIALASGTKLFQDNIEEIFLKSNNIDFIEGYTFSRSSKLRYVDLSLNRISMLSNLALKVADGNLMQVNFLLSGNPFLCDCRLNWLKQRLDLQGENSHFKYTIRDIASLYCNGTGLMKDISILRFLCQYELNCFDPICNCCEKTVCSCRHVCPANCACYRSNNWEDVNFVNCMDVGLTSVPGNLSIGITILDLSGNHLTNINPDNFTDLPRLKELYMNSSRIQNVIAGSIKRITNLATLDLSYNLLRLLFPGMFEGLLSLENLFLRSNRISSIVGKTFNSLKNLKALDMSGNQLQTISGHEFVSLSIISRIWIGHNPWSCQCDYLVDMKNFTLASVDHIIDFKEVACLQLNASVEQLQTYPLVDIHLPDFCRNETIVYNLTRHETVKETLDTASISAMASVLSIFVIGLVIFGLVFWHRDFVKVWCFVKFGWKFNFGKNNDDEDRIYDAFVSYSSKDEAFVVRELVPQLEDGHDGREKFRLCVHFRDFPVGASIAESIISSVENSRRVIIILSDNFLSSEWCQYEFQTAHHRLLEEKKNRIIMILLHEINYDLLDSQLRDYLKTRTYVKYGDPWFWPKIEYAMPKLKTVALNGDRPDIIPKGIVQHRNKVQRKDSDGSDVGDNMIYIMDNMKNFEADDPKRYVFEKEIEM